MITSQKERLDYYETMIGLTETYKANVLKQMAANHVVDIDSLEMTACSESVELIVMGSRNLKMNREPLGDYEEFWSDRSACASEPTMWPLKSLHRITTLLAI